METMGIIDACYMCGEFKKVEEIIINEVWVYCCWDCEKNLPLEE